MSTPSRFVDITIESEACRPLAVWSGFSLSRVWEGVRMLIDELLPVWHFGERHRVATAAPAADLLAAVDQVTWGEVPVMRVLMRARSAGGLRLGSDRTIMADMARLGFTVAARNAEELVAAAIGRPWSRAGGPAPQWRRQPDPARWFVDFAAPGWAKMVVNFRVSPGQLTTETRVQLTDDRSRRAFRRYWLAIRLPSGLIRRQWLAAIVRRAARYDTGHHQRS